MRAVVRVRVGVRVRVRVRVRFRVSHQRLQLSTALRGGEGIQEGISVSPPCRAPVDKHGRHGGEALIERWLLPVYNLVSWL